MESDVVPTSILRLQLDIGSGMYIWSLLDGNKCGDNLYILAMMLNA